MMSRVCAISRSRPTDPTSPLRRNSEPCFRRSRSLSMTLSSLSSLPSEELDDAKFRSKLDPNVAPFAPSKKDDQGPSRISSGSSSSVIHSVDSGCHSDKDETSSGSPPASSAGGRSKEVNIRSLVDLKMKTEVVKFEEDSRGCQSRAVVSAGVTAKMPASVNGSSATSSTYRSAVSSVASASSSGGVDKNPGDDSVFLPIQGQFPPLPGGKRRIPPAVSQLSSRGGSCGSSSCSGNALLPTPDDFPNFGPAPDKQTADCNNNCSSSLSEGGSAAAAVDGDDDQYGLRSLVKAIGAQPNPLTSDPDTRSHFSLAELGFPSEFRDNFFPKRHYFQSPFTNGPLTVMTESASRQIPPEYCHGRDGTGKRLPEPNLRHFSSDLLFFLFYTAVEDQLQVKAACELFRRGWRFHKVRRIWLGRPDIATAHTQRTPTSERGRYQFFDVKKWGRDYVENLTIKYEDVAAMDPPFGPPPCLVPPPPLPRLATPSQAQGPPPPPTPVHQMQGPPLPPPPPYSSHYQMMQYHQHQAHQRQQQQQQAAKIRAATAAAAAAEQEMVQLQQHQQRLQIQHHHHQMAAAAAAQQMYGGGGGHTYNHNHHHEYVRY